MQKRLRLVHIFS